jgi:hypothetical protein
MPRSMRNRPTLGNESLNAPVQASREISCCLIYSFGPDVPMKVSQVASRSYSKKGNNGYSTDSAHKRL